MSLIANTLYGEGYVTRSTRHAWEQKGDELRVRYEWKWAGAWRSMEVTSAARAEPIAEGSVEEFITEHYWGFTRRNAARTSGYEVAHPRWGVYPVRQFVTNVDFGVQYGAEFAALQGQEPASVLLAEGSAIEILGGIELRR